MDIPAGGFLFLLNERLLFYDTVWLCGSDGSTYYTARLYVSNSFDTVLSSAIGSFS